MGALVAQVRVRAAVQLLLVQACGEIFSVHGARVPSSALTDMLDMLDTIAKHARSIDGEPALRHAISRAQAEDQVGPPSQGFRDVGPRDYSAPSAE